MQYKERLKQRITIYLLLMGIFFMPIQGNDKMDLWLDNAEFTRNYCVYAKYCKDPDIVFTIIATAKKYGIPVNIFFALAKYESNFGSGNISKKNRNGTYDIGLFQLNSRKYLCWTLDNLLKPEINAMIAAIHLSDNYRIISKDDWYSALCLYNAGALSNFNKKTRKHVLRILALADKLDKEIL